MNTLDWRVMDPERKRHLRVVTRAGVPVEFQLCSISGGEFIMGSERGLPIAPEGPPHRVTLDEFWIADTVVTGRQFAALMGENPARLQAEAVLPVESVTWLRRV